VAKHSIVVVEEVLCLYSCQLDHIHLDVFMSNPFGGIKLVDHYQYIRVQFLLNIISSHNKLLRLMMMCIPF